MKRNTIVLSLICILLLSVSANISVAADNINEKADKEIDYHKHTWEWMEKRSEDYQEPHYYDPTPGVIDEAKEGALGDVKEIVFASRANGRDWHWYASYGYHIEKENNYYYGGKGGRLSVLNIETGEVRHLVDDPEGDVRDPAVHYDGKTILFSYRKGRTHQYHLYTIQFDGSDLTQLTDSDSFDDMEPCWLPDGDIIFTSSRCMRWVPCWYAQVSTSYRCEADGSDIRQLSFGVEMENTPWVLNDGRVVYTRWEYVNRSQTQFHGLWVFDPDGTGQMVLLNNEGYGGTLYISAKPIPNSPRIATIISPRHGRNEQRGRVGLFDMGMGDNNEDAIRFLDRGYPTVDKPKKGGHLPENSWRDPFPLSEDCYLMASMKSIIVMNYEGDYEILYTLPEGDMHPDVNLHEPRPLVAHEREPIIPETPPAEDGMGTFILGDAYYGRRMDGIEPGAIKKLLIKEEMPKPGAVCAYADSMAPASNYVMHRVYGTVPVEDDGSAHFKVPAGRPLVFVALDENDRAVKHMNSFVSVMSGEVTSCIGCHENRTKSGGVMKDFAQLKATQRPPDQIKPLKDIPQLFDYVRDIQPIWDKHCVKCHNNEKYAGSLNLVGDLSPAYSVGYQSIRGNFLLKTTSKGNPEPYSMGTGDTKLVDVIEKEHHGAKLSAHEQLMVKTWIDAGGTFAGSYASTGDARRDKKIKVPDNVAEVMERRCGECHKTSKKSPMTEGEIRKNGVRVYNLTNPDKSLLLTAPLAKEAGGIAFCKDTKNKSRRFDSEPMDAAPKPIFTSKDDPDYQVLKAFVDEIVEQYNQPRWFMDGFEPYDYYVREMKRFGALPEDFDPAKDKLDPWQTDINYFNIIYRDGPAPETLLLEKYVPKKQD